MLTEETIRAERVAVLPNGVLEIRNATVILRDGTHDPSFPPRYDRYVLEPGADLEGLPERAVAIATAVWTEDVVAAYVAVQAEAQ